MDSEQAGHEGASGLPREIPPIASHANHQAARPAAGIDLSCDQRLLIFMWRHLTLFKILIIFLLIYVAFWLLAARRLANPSIRGRMHFAAEFLSLKESDPATAKRNIYVILAKLKREWPTFSFHFDKCRSPGAPTQRPPTEADFVDTVKRLSLATDGSYEFQDALKHFNTFAQVWYDRTADLECRPDLLHDEQLAKGANISLPLGAADDLRKDAAVFIQNYHIFNGGFSTATDQAKLRPWILLKFYDPKRYLLDQMLPFAFATLLLACSLLLQFRFIDLSRANQWGKKRLPIPKRLANPLWPKVWAQVPEPSAIQSDCQIAQLVSQALSSLVPTQRLKLWIGLAIAAAVFVEFILDVPGIRAEWWVNVPLISAAAATLVIIWSSLAQMRRWKIDAHGLGSATRECRARILRPFLLGGAALMAATLWMISYSVVVLPLGVAERAREITQVVISLVTLFLLAHFAWELHRQPPAPNSPWKITNAEEEALNAEKTGLLDTILPKFDENLIKALLLAIVPFASIVVSFFR